METRSIFCPGCGKKIEVLDQSGREFAFCSECGTKIPLSMIRSGNESQNREAAASAPYGNSSGAGSTSDHPGAAAQYGNGFYAATDRTVAGPDAQYETSGGAGGGMPPEMPDAPGKKHSKLPIIIGGAVAAVAIVVGVLFATKVLCIHKWQDATCTEPITCARCERTQGEPLGHVWQDATCTEPQICSRCGETTGQALGHTWVDATCTEAQYCSVCGETGDPALGHTWVDATCTEAQYCSVCGETGDPALGHESDNQDHGTPATINSAGTSYSLCTRCGEQLDYQAVSQLSPSADSYNFNFTAAEFVEYMGDNISSDYTFRDDGMSDDGDLLYFSMYKNGSYYALMGFSFDESDDNHVVTIFTTASDESVTMAVAIVAAMQIYPDLPTEDCMTDLLTSGRYTYKNLVLNFSDDDDDGGVASLYTSVLD